MAKTTPLDYYGMYLAHNYQFLGYSASMEGRKAEAIDAARKMRDVLPVEMLLGMPGMRLVLSQTVHDDDPVRHVGRDSSPSRRPTRG